MPAGGRAKKPSGLRAIPGGKKKDSSAVEALLSGKVRRGLQKKRRKGEVPPQTLPGDLNSLADVFVAGKALEKEVLFKMRYAEQRIKEHCISDFVNRFIAISKKPGNVDYLSRHARFKFVMTRRTTLSEDKVEDLRSLNIPLEEYTELGGLKINYEAIRQHNLEGHLREALESMHLPKGVIEEVFTPAVELKEAFYDRLDDVVRRSLGDGEDLSEKMLQVLQILNPTTQIRNTEVVGLDLNQCFDLLTQTELEMEEEVA